MILKFNTKRIINIFITLVLLSSSQFAVSNNSQYFLCGEKLLDFQLEIKSAIEDADNTDFSQDTLKSCLKNNTTCVKQLNEFQENEKQLAVQLERLTKHSKKLTLYCLNNKQKKGSEKYQSNIGTPL